MGRSGKCIYLIHLKPMQTSENWSAGKMHILALKFYYHSWVFGSSKLINLVPQLGVFKPTGNAHQSLHNWLFWGELNWVKSTSVIHSAHQNSKSKLCQSWMSLSRKRKIFPSARPQGGALSTQWHVTTWEMYKNLRTEQKEETEAVCDWQAIGHPPGFLLFLQIFYKPWQLWRFSNLASSHAQKIALVLWTCVYMTGHLARLETPWMPELYISHVRIPST